MTDSAAQSLAAVLGQVPLFRLLGPAATGQLAERGGELRMVTGEVLCHEGDEGTTMYVLLDGRLRITKGTGSDEVELAVLGHGDVVGEMSMIDGRPRSATVAATAPCRLFLLDRAEFLGLLVDADDPGFAMSIVSALANRVEAVTERYVAEELSQRLLEAEAEADRHRSLTTLVAGVAHELNTPLGIANTAIGMVGSRVASPQLRDLAADDAGATTLVDEIEEATDLATRNLARANHLIETFKKVSVDQTAASVRTVDLVLAISDVVELLSIRARRAGLTITVTEGLNAEQRTWIGDPGHLTQILTNLLTNIERHAYPDDGGGPVEIGLTAEGPDRTITVTDSGVGMDAGTRAEIFTPFFTTARSSGGSGLGLAIAANLVSDSLRGRIEVESAPGEGTTFRVVFPADPVDQPGSGT
ncbi:MAG: ATP-binding protein [Actinomycetota bacterium]